MREVGICSDLGYACSSTGMTVTSKRSWPALTPPLADDELLLLSFVVKPLVLLLVAGDVV